MATSIEALKEKGRRLRIDSLKATTEAGSGHPSSCLSSADLMSVILFNEMRFDPRDPHNPANDRFVLSKGHAAPLLWSAYADHSNGAACPFDRTNRSFAGLCGSRGSNRISLNKMTDMRSADDKHEDGCPEPASVVAFSESIRSLRPFSLSASIDVAIHFHYIYLIHVIRGW